MVTGGYAWLHAVRDGCRQWHMITDGYVRICTDTNGYRRLHAATNGYTVTYGYRRLHTVTDDACYGRGVAIHVFEAPCRGSSTPQYLQERPKN